MTETIRFPNGTSVLIEQEMGVVPRCGSCFEPLLSEAAWYAVCIKADELVGSGQHKGTEVIEALIGMVAQRAAQGHLHEPELIIEEEP